MKGTKSDSNFVYSHIKYKSYKISPLLRKKISIYLICITGIFSLTNVHSQTAFIISSFNAQKEVVRKSGIKSLSVWEYHYANDASGSSGNSEAFKDSGYKSFHYEYDRDGRVTEYTKYHVFSDLTVRELYKYNTVGTFENTTRYNASGDVIETIVYKFNSSGRLKNELHTAYYNTIKPGIYFTILASVHDDTLFSMLQQDLEIEPLIEAYSITINISDPEEQNQYIVIGDESDATSPRYSWSQLSMNSQKGLLGWKGPNRKEHTYISKNISRVIYKYDSKGNLMVREVYNTADDLIEREYFNYNNKNYRSAYYKYNENGIITEVLRFDTNDKKEKLTKYMYEYY